MGRCFEDVPWKLYGSRGISSWGDRMWMFAVGLFMIELSPGSLKWTAIYGLSQSLSIILIAPVIGRWVDRTPRFGGSASVSFKKSTKLVEIQTGPTGGTRCHTLERRSLNDFSRRQLPPAKFRVQTTIRKQLVMFTREHELIWTVNRRFNEIRRSNFAHLKIFNISRRG